MLRRPAPELLEGGVEGHAGQAEPEDEDQGKRHQDDATAVVPNDGLGESVQLHRRRGRGFSYRVAGRHK